MVREGLLRGPRRRNASAAEVKKAYRKLAQQHHPDTKQGDPDAENRFKEISAAYDVLGDAEKRKAYDQVRDMSASGFGPGFGRLVPGSRRGSRMAGGVRYEQVNVDDLGDLFGGLFGGAGGGAAVVPPRSVAPTWRRRSRSRSRTPWRARPCRSRSTVRRARGATDPAPSRDRADHVSSVGGAARSRRTRGSSPCRGPARAAAAPGGSWSPVHKCGGSGAERRTRTLQVKIPAGVRNGARIRLAARASRGRRAGAPATSS